jgi:hypothetical protein
MEMSGAIKYSKESVNYGPSKNPGVHCCKVCAFLLKPGGTHGVYWCGIVSGPIKELDGCEKFEVDLVKNANNPYTPKPEPNV